MTFLVLGTAFLVSFSIVGGAVFWANRPDSKPEMPEIRSWSDPRDVRVIPSVYVIDPKRVKTGRYVQ
jgi:hypothetical protein